MVGSDPWSNAVLVLAAAAALVPSAVSAIVAPGRDDGAEVERLVRGALLLGFAAVITLLVRRSLHARDRPVFRNAWLVVALLAYWLVGMASLIWNSRALPQLSALAVPLIILGLAAYGGRTPRSASRFLETCLLAVCYASLVLAVVYPSAAFPRGPRFEAARYLGLLSDDRLAGIVSHPNTLGFLSATGVLLVAVHRRPLWPVHLACALLVLVLSESRVAVAAVVISLALVAAVQGSTGEAARDRLVLGPGALLWVFVALLPLLSATGLMSLDFNGRAPVWDYALSRFDERPLLGFGPGVWRDFVLSGDLPELATSGHNQFVESATTVGTLGLVALTVLVCVWLRSITGHREHELRAVAGVFVLVTTVATLESPVSLWAVGPLSWLVIMALVVCLGERATSPTSQAGIGSSSGRP